MTSRAGGGGLRVLTVLVYLDDLNHLAGTALGVRMGAELTSKMLYLSVGPFR